MQAQAITTIKAIISEVSEVAKVKRAAPDTTNIEHPCLSASASIVLKSARVAAQPNLKLVLHVVCKHPYQH